MTDQQQGQQAPSLLAQLRALVPERVETAHAALLIAEAQADCLRRVFGAVGGRFNTAGMASLPRLHIARRSLPTSGVTYWNGRLWHIDLNRDEPSVRQRFTLLHEYKHIIDHGAVSKLYGDELAPQRERAEATADYFAGCVLMPRAALLDQWAQGRSVEALARHFGASERAIGVRLGQLGIGERERCARPMRSVGTDQQFRIATRKAVA